MKQTTARMLGLRDLVPFYSCEYEIPASCEEFIERIRSVVKCRSFIFVNYWKHKGNFVGSVTDNRFRLVRYIRDFYVPVVIGHVTPSGAGCRLSVRFLGIQFVILLAGYLLLPVLMARQFGLRAVLFIVPIAFGHIIGCLHYKREVTVFLRAAGIESELGGSSATESRVSGCPLLLI